MSGMQATRLKWMAKVLAIGLGVLIPTTTAFAWFCGTGRMTGGGKLVSLVADTDAIDVTSPTTNGYELHCDGSHPNNLQINSHDPNGPHFHLAGLQTANCYTTFGNQNPPAAGFDTYEGLGVGEYSIGNDRIWACAEWVFIDGSQGKGSTNTSYIRITDEPPLSDTDICPAPPLAVVGKCPGNTLLLVPTQTPLNGNNQAHKN
jgi:hypothetical protein